MSLSHTIINLVLATSLQTKKPNLGIKLKPEGPRGSQCLRGSKPLATLLCMIFLGRTNAELGNLLLEFTT